MILSGTEAEVAEEDSEEEEEEDSEEEVKVKTIPDKELSPDMKATSSEKTNQRPSGS